MGAVLSYKITMAFLLLQKGLEAPGMEQMKAAFRGVPGLTPMDAAMMCRNSLGILARGLDAETAQLLQANLSAEGVETDIAEQSALPVLPPMRHITKLDCVPEGLRIHDPSGNSFLLEGKDIMLIAAGKVSVIEFKRTNTVTMQDPDAGLRIIDDLLFEKSGLPLRPSLMTVSPDSSYHTEEVHRQKLITDIVIRGGGLRYNMEVDVADNFAASIQYICKSAPGAAVNRGAYYFREGNPAAFSYPSKNAFYDEMIWLLWRLKGQEA